MIVSISNPLQATWIFSLVFFVVLFASVRPRRLTEWFPTSLTTELKGAAILMIVISHIGYFLVSDTRFLWPLSIMAGVGVNIFLFLSGYGLTASSLQKKLSVGQFYWRRLYKLFLPFWLVLMVFLTADYFILGKSYSLTFIWQSFLGIFTHADLYTDFNSPLWYFTLILIYYLIFPLVFFRKRLWLTAIILFIVGDQLIKLDLKFLENVMYLYRVHIVAFPLGVLAAWTVSKLPSAVILEKLSLGWRKIGYYLVMLVLVAIFIYANINSGIGGTPAHEQWVSVLAVLAIALVFVMKKFEFRLFSLFGLYSYEIYLWHWPLMYRYDIFYNLVPPWLATILYLALFIGVGLLAQKVSGLFIRSKKVIAEKQK